MKEIEKFKIKENEFVINNSILTVSVNNQKIKLTNAEFCILNYLIHHQRVLISKREIDTRVLNLRLDRDGEICSGRFSTYSHVAAIRRALNKISKGLGNIIVTRPRFGYYLDNDNLQYQS
jgi:DNA-binding winged helix-turn-helix (wHTH) protein